MLMAKAALTGEDGRCLPVNGLGVERGGHLQLLVYSSARSFTWPANCDEPNCNEPICIQFGARQSAKLAKLWLELIFIIVMNGSLHLW